MSSVDFKLRLPGIFQSMFSLHIDSGGQEGRNIVGAEFDQALEQEDWVKDRAPGRGNHSGAQAGESMPTAGRSWPQGDGLAFVGEALPRTSTRS